MKLINHADIVDKMNEKYGKLYSKQPHQGGHLSRHQDR